MKPICKIRPDGTKEWHLDGQLHREDGPAIEYVNGAKRWYIKDKLHRTDGPAVEDADGDKKYFLGGKEYSFDEWDRLRKMLWML